MSIDAAINFGGSGQGFGRYRLDTYNDQTGATEGSAFGCDFILRLMKLFKVERFSDIEGKRVYALRNEAYGDIVGLEIPFCEDNGGAKLIFADVANQWKERTK
jgi:hypothetical protein